METFNNNLFLTHFAAAEGGGGLGFFLPLLLMIAAMYFLVIAPQRKRQKEHEKVVDTLTKGDKVILSSGIFGTIVNVKDDRFSVQIAESTKIDVQKAAVQGKISDDSSAS